MLNTDFHNVSVKPDRKMKLEDFVKNMRDELNITIAEAHSLV